jgi:hypothetical protein
MSSGIIGDADETDAESPMGNKAMNGGGVYHAGSGTTTFLFKGGIIGARTNAPSTSSLLDGNYVTGSGAGVYITGGIFLTQGGFIQENKADGNGGGIFVNGGTANLQSCTIGSYDGGGSNPTNYHGNEADSGGGVYRASGTVTKGLTGTLYIVNNKATVDTSTNETYPASL